MTQVMFGSVPATSFSVDSDNQITATSPDGTPGLVDVTVATPDVSNATNASDQYTYPGPKVTGIQPANGPKCGGTQVTVTGSGFAGASAVNFGTTAATSFTVKSDTEITATSPGGTDTVDVTVTVPPYGTSPASAADQFTYTLPDKTNLGRCPYALFGRNSVNLSTGNLIHQATDLDIPSVGPPLEFTRFYNSQDDYVGPQGRGWTNNLNLHLTISYDGTVSVAYADGHVYIFTPSSISAADSISAGEKAAAVKPASVVMPPSPSPTYTAPPGCYEMLTGNSDSNTYTLTFKDHTYYTFNSIGQLTSITDKNNNTITLTYSNSSTYSLSDGSLAPDFAVPSNPMLTSATDQLGHSLTFTYDVSNRLTGITDSIGRVIDYTYDASGNLYQVQAKPLATDPDQIIRTTKYLYDSHGLTQIIQPNGNNILTNTYDDSNRVITQADGDVNAWQFGYGPHQTTLTGALSDITYIYDDQYRVTELQSTVKDSETGDSETDSTQYTYTDGTNPFLYTQFKDANKQDYDYTYDVNGNLKTSKNDTTGMTTAYNYDNNNLISTIDPAKREVDYTYDSNSNLTSVVDKSDPGPTKSTTTSYTYYPNGQLWTRTDPPNQLGDSTGATTYTYQNGYPSTVTDPTGVTNYSYDAVGRLLSVADSHNNATVYTYDSAGNRLTSTDPLGNEWSYTYDANGNMLTSTDPKNNLLPDGERKQYQYTYDGNNLLQTETDPLNDMTRYYYDGENNQSRVKDANSYDTNYAYDQKSRLTSVTDATGYKVSYTYNATDNIHTTTSPNGTTTYSYDDNYNVKSVQDANGNTYQYNYNIKTQTLDDVTDPESHNTSFTHDPQKDLLIQTTDPIKSDCYQGFDNNGNRISLTDINKNNDQFEYDAAGRLTKRTLPTGKFSTCSYNDRGLLGHATNFRSQETTYQYDNAGRLSSFTDPAGTVSHTYDANGNIHTISDSGGAITKTYDDLNRVISYTDSQNNTIQYTYDGVGNLKTLIYPDGKIVQYGYDNANRLKTVTDWAGRTTTYNYDNSLLTGITRPDGSVQTSAYDPAGRLTDQTDLDKNGKVISQYDITEYDKNGNVLKEDSATPTQPFTQSDAALAFDNTGKGDNRLAIYNGQSVTYDDDGNMENGPLNGQMTGYAFNARNELTGVGNTTYQYDAEGNRIGMTKGSSQTSYIVNLESSLSQVLAKTGANGQTDYVYGLGLIGQEDAGGYRIYHFDDRDNTVALTDTNGNITDRYQYEPFGALTYHLGTASTTFLFDGRDGVMTDANGLLCMRARYYNPEARRFISRDSVNGSINKPQALNSYSFTNNNPINYYDPNGKDAMVIGDTKNIFNFGHMSGLFEDEGGLWWYFYWGPKNFTGDIVLGISVEGFARVERVPFESDLGSKKIQPLSSLHDLNSWLNYSGIYPRSYDASVYIIGDFSKSVRYINALKEFAAAGRDLPQLGLDTMYNLFHNNCAQQTLEALLHGDFNNKESLESLKSVLRDLRAPNLIERQLQNFFNNSRYGITQLPRGLNIPQ